MTERLRDVGMPQTLDEALRVAKSLVSWMEWIKANGSMFSNGGWVDLHLASLNVWNQKEKIEASAKALNDSLKEFEASFCEKTTEKKQNAD